MDPEHPDQIGKTRGTIWEIHPIMQIETQTLTGWKPLDDGTTGMAVHAGSRSDNSTHHARADRHRTAHDQRQRPGQQECADGTIFYDGRKSTEPDEFVELINKGTGPVDITDWELQDTTGKTEYKWESYILQPGATIRVYTNEVHQDSGGFSFQAGRAIWNNSGDVAELYDSDGQLVSRYAYGNKK